MHTAEVEKCTRLVNATLLTEGSSARCVVPSFIPTSLVHGPGTEPIRLSEEAPAQPVRPTQFTCCRRPSLQLTSADRSASSVA
jgi:hypothetical protein